MSKFINKLTSRALIIQQIKTGAIEQNDESIKVLKKLKLLNKGNYSQKRAQKIKKLLAQLSLLDGKGGEVDV